MNAAHKRSTPTLLENDETACSKVEVISQATKTPPTTTPYSDSAAQRQLKP